MKPVPLLLVVLIILALPVAALADGGPAMKDAALKAQPARTLAQQALALLDVRKDEKAAIMRIDAALESKHREDVDRRLLAQADEALDGGDREGAIELLNRALGGGPLPVGDEEATAPSGDALHNAGRAFEPNSTAQETIAAILGAALLLLGGLLVLRHRRLQHG
jgi:hypothetical protein